MTTFNDHNNLTAAARDVVRAFMDREFQAISQEAVQAMAGDYDEDIEELTPRTLVCDTCAHAVEEGQSIIDEDGDEVEAEPSCACPACISDATLKCRECGREASNTDHKPGDRCPACGNVIDLDDDSEIGLLDYNDEDEYGALPMWGTMWECGGWAERQIRADVRIATDAGFRVYEVAGNLYLGIDGAGYSFGAPHFAPLYRALTGNKLPGDPVYTCDSCGYQYEPNEVPPAPEGTTRPEADSFTHGPFTADGGLRICDCTRCSAGTIFAHPYVTAAQRREEQRDRAVTLCLRLLEAEKGAWRRDDSLVGIFEEARALLSLTEGG